MQQEGEEFQRLASLCLPLLESYWKEGKVCEVKTPEELQTLISFSFSAEPQHWDGVASYIKDLIFYSPRTRNPLFLDKLYPGTNPIGIIAEMVTAMLNTNLHVFKVSPVITITELAVMKTLCCLFGFPTGDGLTCPGGSFSNMLALITARNTAFPEIKREGYQNFKEKLLVFTSEEAHYSIAKACMVIGIGIDNIIKIKTNTNGSMKAEELRSSIISAIESGRGLPFFVNATAGTTVKGAYDPFSEIGAICSTYNCWFHIDACWGGTAIFSSKHAYLLKGCERADSLAWNAHKLLGVPIQTSILLMKKKGALEASNSLANISYLFHDNPYDVGNKTIMCGRRADVLKFYITWLYYGSTAFEAWTNKAFANASNFASLLRNRDDFQILFPVNSVNVCFVYIPTSMCIDSDRESILELNKKIHKELTEAGDIFIDFNDSATLGMYFRVVFHSPLTEQSHLEFIVTQLVSKGEEIQKRSK